MKRSPLLHPLALAALALLVLNDHVLKARFPGLVTGKLSDLAGMVLAPLFVLAIADALAPASLARRRAYATASAWACVLFVACAFTLTKTWTPAAHFYETVMGLARTPFRWIGAWTLGRPLWTEHVVLVRDPTDLVALPFGLLAVWIARPRPQAA